jgi:chondroitin 4-sulfotransferase 11
VDFIGRFERIQEDFGVISRRLGMEIELPHLNKSNLSGVYRDAYSERMRKIVGEIYELDARIFEYDF